MVPNSISPDVSGISPSKYRSVRPLQWKNALSPIDFKVSGKIREVSILHSLNACPPRDTRLSPSSTDARYVHPLKAESPMLSVPRSRITLRSDVQLMNADSPMIFIPVISTDSSELQYPKALSGTVSTPSPSSSDVADRHM